jgi:hypothetical protein
VSEKNDGGWAFPWHGGQHRGDDPRNRILGGGMTLRDYFAARAMHALLASPTTREAPDALIPAIASFAYQFADAMLREREK